MEYITEAVQRARKQAVQDNTGTVAHGHVVAARNTSGAAPQTARTEDMHAKGVHIEPFHVDTEFLLRKRIVTLDSEDASTRIFDMLRNHLVNENKEVTGPLTIAVTAPSPRCGTSFAAANLAFSFARSGRQKVIVMDVGPRSGSDLSSVLGLPIATASRATSDPLALVELRSSDVSVYYGCCAVKKSASQGATALQTRIKSIVDAVSPSVVVVDLPPLLSDDGNVKFALDADVVLLVLAVGQSSGADLRACQTFLGSRQGVQLFLNKNRWHGL